MRYINAADVLPEKLVEEISEYVNGELLYIPARESKCAWGDKSGSRQYYEERNRKIRDAYQSGKLIKELALEFQLSYETIRKIIRK